MNFAEEDFEESTRVKFRGLDETERSRITSFISSSEFIRNYLLKNEHLLFDIQNTELPLTIDDYFQRYPRLENFSSYEEFYDFAQQMKMEMLTRIAYLDFTEKEPVETITSQLSLLAEFSIHLGALGAIRRGDYKHIDLQFVQQESAIVGMGKLGGGELNISSDIDLIFFASERAIKDYEKKKELTRFFQSLMDFLHSHSRLGFLYRVDMRLRPEGSSGPLVAGELHAIDYYTERARLWEIQAMIKARHLWGNEEISARILHSTRKRIYSAHDPEMLLAAVRKMKSDIEGKLPQDAAIIDLKLGEGGIRDIEFIVQFMQLIHGTHHEELRIGTTAETLTRLRAFRIISEDEYLTLSSHYTVLRKLENIIQLRENLQEHTLPLDNDILEKLYRPWCDLSSILPTFDSPGSFRLQVMNVQQKVRTIFTALFHDSMEFIQVKKRVQELLDNSFDHDYLFHHFARLDSEYFIRFSPEEIAHHLRMIAQLGYNKLSDISIVKSEDPEVLHFYLTIVAFDYDYEFSKIAGLISSFQLMIDRGESYTYAHFRDDEDTIKAAVYRRSRKAIYRGKNYSAAGSRESILKKKKIVFTAEVSPQNYSERPDWTLFKDHLETLLEALENNNQDEASRILNNRLYSLPIDAPGRQHALAPVEIDVDNSSSALYTILTIKSRDSFAFLYNFTNTLALRNYYIYKVKIETHNDELLDRIFVMTSSGKKIEGPGHIDELKIMAALIKQYTALLSHAADIHRAVTYFESLITRILESSGKDELPIIGQHDVQQNLASIFGGSRFLWEDLLRINYHEMLPLLTGNKLEAPLEKKELEAMFYDKYCGGADPLTLEKEEFTSLLNRFKDTEMFRIDARQLSGKIDFWHFANELTDLADTVISLAIKRSAHDILYTSENSRKYEWAIFGLGKLGGRELGYASDIELMFVYDIPDAYQDDRNAFSLFEQMLKEFIQLIRAKKEGIFEIDMNLRPHGNAGSLAVSLASFKEYFSEGGGSAFFERQALIKMRSICSSPDNSRVVPEVMDHRDTFVYSSVYPDLTSLYKMRKLQLENYIDPLKETNLKYSPGCLVEIEYITQVLQLYFGQRGSEVRKTSTLDALRSLHDKERISPKQYHEFREAYIFFRVLINTLRMVKGNARDLTLYPHDSIEYDFLLKRAHFAHILDNPDRQELMQKLKLHTGKIAHYFHNITALLKPE